MHALLNLPALCPMECPPEPCGSILDICIFGCSSRLSLVEQLDHGSVHHPRRSTLCQFSTSNFTSLVTSREMSGLNQRRGRQTLGCQEVSELRNSDRPGVACRTPRPLTARKQNRSDGAALPHTKKDPAGQRDNGKSKLLA